MNDGRIIIDKIMADAAGTPKKIISEAQKEADITISAAEDKAAREKIKNDKLVEEEKEKATANQLSSAQMQAKKAILAQKQDILEEVINEARNRLVNLSDAEYVKTIGTMLDNIDKKLGTEIIVSADDRKRLSDVISEKGFTLSDRTANIDGGLIVKDGDIEYNYSFSSIIAIEKEEIQQIAAKILFE